MAPEFLRVDSPPLDSQAGSPGSCSMPWSTNLELRFWQETSGSLLWTRQLAEKYRDKNFARFLRNFAKFFRVYLETHAETALLDVVRVVRVTLILIL